MELNEMALLEQLFQDVAPATSLEYARERVVAETMRTAPHRRGGRRTRISNPRRLVAGLGLAGAMAATVVAAEVVAPGQAPPANAAQVLQRAATAALAQPEPRNDQYVYTRTTTFAIPSPETSQMEQWQSVDGSKPGLARLTPCPEMHRRIPGTHPVRIYSYRMATCDMTMPANDPTNSYYSKMRLLPTDPSALLAYIDKHYNDHRIKEPADMHRWSGLCALIGSNPVLPPKLAAAAFKAAASIPGVTLDWTPAGAKGVGVAKTMDGTRLELVFDPKTYALRAMVDVAVAKSNAADAPVGQVTYSWTLLSSRFVKSRPAGNPLPGAATSAGTGWAVDVSG